VEFEPPMKLPRVPAVENGPLTAYEEVATDETPAPPFEVRIWPPVRFEVVLMPQYVSVEFEPPTKAPKVPAVLKGPLTAYEEVATDCSAALPTGPA
jgi:hypothetical protein